MPCFIRWESSIFNSCIRRLSLASICHSVFGSCCCSSFFFCFFFSPNKYITQVKLHQIQYCWCTTVCTVHKMIANELASQLLITAIERWEIQRAHHIFWFPSRLAMAIAIAMAMEMKMKMKTGDKVEWIHYNPQIHKHNSHKWITEL